MEGFSISPTGKECDSKNLPLVSIITPTYNHEDFIGNCIESVLAQTYPFWEQIIIDDGSTDGTERVVGQFDDKRIKYIKQDNFGIFNLSATYNRALKASKGKLIAILEGDDSWPSNKLEKQVPIFGRHDIVLSWGKAIVINRYNKPLWITPNDIKKLEQMPNDKILQNLILRNIIPACTAMCRKDALLHIGGFQQPPLVPYVDYPTWLELSLIGELKPVDEILGHWRRHEDQATNMKRIEMGEGYSRCVIPFFQRLPYSIKKYIDLSPQDLQDASMHNIAIMHFRIGRICLFKRQWAQSRENFKSAIYQGTAGTRAMALIGIICSYIKLNLEWAAPLMNVTPLDKLK